MSMSDFDPSLLQNMYIPHHNHYHRSSFDIIRDQFHNALCNALDVYCRKNKLLSIKDRSKHLIKLNPKILNNGVKDFSYCFPGILKIDDVFDTNVFITPHKSFDVSACKLDKDAQWIILEDVPDIYNILDNFIELNNYVKQYSYYNTPDISSVANMKHIRYENPFWSNARLIIIGHIYPSSSSSSSSSSLLFDNDNNTIDKGNKIIGFDSIPYEIILIIVKYITYSAIYTKYCNNCDKILKKVLLCSKCKICHYCDVTCQKADWNKRHKKICTDFLKYGWVK